MSLICVSLFLWEMGCEEMEPSSIQSLSNENTNTESEEEIANSATDMWECEALPYICDHLPAQAHQTNHVKLLHSVSLGDGKVKSFALVRNDCIEEKTRKEVALGCIVGRGMIMEEKRCVLYTSPRRLSIANSH